MNGETGMNGETEADDVARWRKTRRIPVPGFE